MLGVRDWRLDWLEVMDIRGSGLELVELGGLVG